MITLVSNPPYISLDEYKKLDAEIKDYEPEFALTDYEDGLKFYERVILISSRENFCGKVFFETGFGQKKKWNAS